MKKRISDYLTDLLTFNVFAGYIWQYNAANLYFLSSGRKLFSQQEDRDKQKSDEKSDEHRQPEP